MTGVGMIVTSLVATTSGQTPFPWAVKVSVNDPAAKSFVPGK